MPSRKIAYEIQKPDPYSTDFGSIVWGRARDPGMRRKVIED